MPDLPNDWLSLLCVVAMLVGAKIAANAISAYIRHLIKKGR